MVVMNGNTMTESETEANTNTAMKEDIQITSQSQEGSSSTAEEKDCLYDDLEPTNDVDMKPCNGTKTITEVEFNAENDQLCESNIKFSNEQKNLAPSNGESVIPCISEEVYNKQEEIAFASSAEEYEEEGEKVEEEELDEEEEQEDEGIEEEEEEEEEEEKLRGNDEEDDISEDGQQNGINSSIQIADEEEEIETDIEDSDACTEDNEKPNEHNYDKPGPLVSKSSTFKALQTKLVRKGAEMNGKTHSDNEHVMDCEENEADYVDENNFNEEDAYQDLEKWNEENQKHHDDPKSGSSSSSSSKSQESSVSSKSSIRPSVLAVFNEARGYFEIGKCLEGDERLSLHSFSISVHFVKGLQKVIPRALLRECKQGPCISYSLLGCPVFTDPIRDISKATHPAEQANCKIMATPDNIKNYFSANSIMKVRVMIGEMELASTKVDLSKLSGQLTRVKSAVGVEKSCLQIENAYEFKPAEGNAVQFLPCSSRKGEEEALIGLSIELQRLLDTPFLSKSKAHSEAVSTRLPKRSRQSSTSSDDVQASDDLVNDQIPPSKRRKVTAGTSHESTTAENKSENVSENKEKQEDTEKWKRAKDELEKWKQAQENVFWKQWLIREKNLQECLTEKWKDRVENMEAELVGKLEAVEEERTHMEEQWRRLHEREERCARMEEKLMALQEEVMEQQASLLGRQSSGTSVGRQAGIIKTRLPMLGAPEDEDQLSYTESSYKSRWLRGVATTHKKWSTGLSNHHGSPSSLLMNHSPSLGRSFPNVASGSRSSPLMSKELSNKRFDSLSRFHNPITDEIARLTKERKSLLTSHGQDSSAVKSIDQTINKLLHASGV